MKIFDRGHKALDLETLQRILREGDPASEMPPDRAYALRSATLRAAAQRTAASSPARPRPLFVVACALAAGCLALAVGLNQRAALDGPAPAVRTAASEKPAWVSYQPASPDQELSQKPSQIQFQTPGGTRIIWLLVADEPQVRRPI